MSIPEDVEMPGKVLDVAVLTKSCKQCHIYEELPHNSVEYLQWKATHVCSINHQGSAGSMETEGAIMIFHRSVEKHKLQYKTTWAMGTANVTVLWLDAMDQTWKCVSCNVSAMFKIE